MSSADQPKDCKVAHDLNKGHKDNEDVHTHHKTRGWHFPYPHFHLAHPPHKQSLSDSGPFTLEKSPETGHYICRKNGKSTNVLLATS